jgi:hypothetical protein
VSRIDIPSVAAAGVPASGGDEIRNVVVELGTSIIAALLIGASDLNGHRRAIDSVCEHSVTVASRYNE